MARSRLARVIAPLVALSALALTVPALGLPGARELLRAAKESLAARDWGAARGKLDELLRSDARANEADEAALLRVRTLALAGEHQAALQAADELLRERAASPLAAQARYARARALLALGREADAAAALEARMEELAGARHREELAGLWLQVADAHWFEPGAPLPPERDPGTERQRALRGYEQALSLGPPAARREEALLRAGLCLLELGQPDEARERCARLRRDSPTHLLAPRAAVEEGRALLALGRRDEARALWRQVTAAQPAWDQAPRALLLLAESCDPAEDRLQVELLEELLRRFAEDPLAPEARLRLAGVHEAAGRLEPALLAWRELVARHPDHPLADQASLSAARLLVRMQRFEPAREALAAHLARYPASATFAPAQDDLARTWIEEGEARLAASDAAGALAAWGAFLERYPVHEAAPAALIRIGEVHLQAGRTDQALQAWGTAAERYVGSQSGAAAQLLVARTCEERLQDLPRATREWAALVERFPGTSQAEEGRRALVRLKEKHLRLLTASARSLAQGAAVQLATRNVQELELKAVKLDLVEYFERKQHVGQVEALAIEVVKPDHTWKEPVPAYEPFRLFERELALPRLQGPGAWVLTAEEETWKATTLVLVSDLTLVVKRAPGQVLAFVTDAATMKPAPGVDVLVSNGSKVVLRGKTGPDGTWLGQDAALGGQARVLVHRAGHVAFDDGTPGQRGAFAWQTKVWAFTDRPVYRPGHIMRWKAFCRRVANEAYAYQEGEEARVSIVDARGVRRTQETLPLSRLGSLQGELALGEEPPLGEWALEVVYAGHTWRSAFAVEAYRKPEVVIEATALEGDVLAGEPLVARIAVRTFYGSPVAGAPVSWTLYRTPSEFDREARQGFAWFRKVGRPPESPPPPEHVASGQAVADAEGTCTLTLPTAAVDRDQLYTLLIESRGQDQVPVAGSLNVHATTRGFFALVQADARVVRPKAPFKTLVETVDARYRGVAARGELQVLRIVGGGGEEVVDRTPVQTDAAGRAELELSIARPGDHVLRFVGADRKGGRVEGQDRLIVAGVSEDQEPSVRLRADREVYRRGEKARVLVNGPAAGALALLTWEGERVLRHQVLTLAERSQTLELELDDACSPNVFLRLAVPHQGRLLEDQDEVLVFKFLELAVKSAKAEYGPGEEVSLELEARDQAGNPVEAEVALSVVDEAIYAIRADATPEARPFFYDQRRTLAVTTGSSLDWRYEGVLARQQADLLAEREERELAGQLALEDEGRRGAMGGMRAKGEAAPKPSAPPAAGPMKNGEKKLARDALAKEADGFAGAPAEEAAPEPTAEAPAEPRRLFADTALWAPSVVTGKDGKARVSFKLPDDLTRWRVTARGLSADTLAGDATAGFVSARDLVVRLALPRVVTELDEWTKGLIVDNRRNLAVTGQAGIELAGQKSEQPLQLGAFAAQRLDWGPALAPGPLPLGPLTVKGWARANDKSDALERVVGVVPAGWTERTARSGLLEGDATLALQLPEDVVPGSARLSVRLIPDGAAALLDGLVYLEAFPHGCTEQTVSRFLPLVAAGALLEQVGLPREDVRRRLRDGLLRGVGRLLELQRDDGGWGWWAEGPAQPALTGYALYGLVMAARAGAFVDPGALGRGRDAALAALREAGGDQEARAVLCLALAAAGVRQELQDDLNRLTRERGSLSTQALALCALARRQTEGNAPGDLLDALRERLRDLPGGARPPKDEPRQPWGGAEAEGLAWAGVALLQARPQGDEALHGALLAFLRGSQSPDGSWRSTRETAAVLLYLAAAEGRRREQLDLKVTVQLGGDALSVLRLRGIQPGAERTLVVPPERLRPGKLELRLLREGAGTPRYVAELSWVRRGLPAEGARTGLLALERGLIAGEAEGRARAFPHLDSILEGGAGVTPRALETLSVGQRAWLTLALEAREDLPFAVAEVPLPAGVEVLTDHVEGEAPDRLEAWDDRLVLFWSALPAGRLETRVLVQAVTPGRFALRPASGWLMYAPEVQARSGAMRLTVQPEDAAGREPSPDERLLQVRALVAQEKWKEARPLLEGLAALKLVVEARIEVLYRLFQVGLRTEDPRLAVRSFEALVDLDPRHRELPLGERRELARAYRAAGEPRRAGELALQVLVLLFREEQALVAVQREEGRPVDAQRTLSGLLLAYPDEEAVIESWLELAQAWLAIPREPTPGQARPKHWRPERPQDVRVEEAWTAFKDFCAWFPLDPRAAAAQAGAVEALAALGDQEGVAAEALAFARRYPRDERLDDVLVQRLRALHQLARWDEAFAAGKELLAWREPAPAGSTPRGSPFQDEVLHTFARIHHQRGELAQAVELYARVRGRIPDAQDAWTWLTQSALQVPDLVRAAPGTEVRLPVRSKNVAAIGLEVYPVDLMVLFLTRKSLAGIQDVDLTGVTPLVRQRVELGKTTDFAWKDTQAPLPVKDPGVYLVVGKAGSAITSTVVVISGLELEVQRAPARVRVYLRTREGQPAAGAKVRVSDGQRLVGRGSTDARGVCDVEAQVAPGRLSVVVEREGHYALYREGEGR